jgi:hypothetical protein
MKNIEFEWQDHRGFETIRALKMSAVCKEIGLEYSKDYTWHLDSIRQRTIFIFENEKNAVLFLMRWR